MNNRYKSQSPYSEHMCSEGDLMRSLGLGHKAKRDCTSCSALNSPRRSLLTTCHTVSRCTRESNSIYVIKKTEAFTSRFSRRPQMLTFRFLIPNFYQSENKCATYWQKFIYAPKKGTDFSMSIDMSLPFTQQVTVDTSWTDLHPSRNKTVENRAKFRSRYYIKYDFLLNRFSRN